MNRKNSTKRLRFFNFLIVRPYLSIGTIVCLVGLYFFNFKSFYLEQNLYQLTTKMGWTTEKVYLIGRHEENKKRLEEIALALKGQPLLEIDTKALKQKVTQSAWVKKAAIQRKLPNTLNIFIDERKAIAIWQHKKKHVLIDKRGVSLGISKLQKYKELPIVVGENAHMHALSLIELLENNKVISDRIKASAWVSNRRWNIHLKNGIVILFPENDLSKAWTRLIALQNRYGILDRDIVELDLRLSDRLTVKVNPNLRKMLFNYNEI